MNRFSFGFGWAGALLAAVFSACVAAGERGPALDKNGVAAKGYDPVAYFVDRNAVKGSPEFGVQLDNGAIYHFVSAENRNIFIADPSRYAPQFGGFCAVAAANGAKVKSDPKAFRIVDGKLYLMASTAKATQWSQDPSNLIKKADAKWAVSRAK